MSTGIAWPSVKPPQTDTGLTAQLTDWRTDWCQVHQDRRPRPRKPAVSLSASRLECTTALVVEQGSAYACPMHAYAGSPRRATSNTPPARTRSSPATSRRAHPAPACVRSREQAPRNPPEKRAPPTPRPTRKCWSQGRALQREREEPTELVAGAGFEPATFGL